MIRLRISLLAVVTVLLVALMGCEAVNEVPEIGSAPKEVQLETQSVYVPTMPLQVTYVGTTTGAPTWHRPDQYGGSSSIATDVPYHVQEFEVGGEGTYDIHSEQDYDGFLLLYGVSFDPTDPLTGFAVGSDDYGSVGESLVSAYLFPDTTYYVVTTGYSNDDHGFFVNRIYGSYAVTGVEPGYEVSYAASTEGAPTWNRLESDGTLSTWVTEVPYHVQAFSVGGTGTYHARSVQDFDGFLFLYGGGFDPADPVTGFIACNDDYRGMGQSAVTAELAHGTTYYLVTTGYEDLAQGSFTNTVFGSHAITLDGDVDPVEATHDLIDDVERLADDGVLKAGQDRGLIRPLENALRSLDKEKWEDACNQLGDFVVEVEAKVPPLTGAQASELIADATAIQEALACE